MVRRRNAMRSRGGGRGGRGIAGAAAWVLLLLGLVGVAHAAPSITTSSGANTYVERTGLGEFFVDTGLTVSSTTTLSFCQIHIIEPADVSLTVGDQLDVVVSNGLTRSAWSSDTRSFTISTPTGTTVSVESYQLVLRKLTFYNPASNPATNVRTIKYTLVDVDGNQAEATKAINIQLQDDTPTVTLTSATRATYTEQLGNVTLDSTVTLADPDSDSLTSGSIQITSGYEAGKDILSLNQDVTILRAPDEVTPYGLVGSWDATTGTLNVTGSAPVSVYQDIFRKVLFINNDIAPSTTTRVFTYLVRDESTTSTAVLLTMPFTDVNQIPVLTLTSAATLAYSEGTPLVLDSGATLTDADHTTLSSVTVTIDQGYESTDVLTATTTGSVSFSYSGGVGSFSGSGTVADFQSSLRTVTYDTTGENPTGTRRVRYDVSDGRDSVASQYRTITVSAVNDAPVVTGNTTSFELQGRETMIMTDVAITDVDSTLLSGATMTISTGCAAATDSITAIVAVPEGLTGSYSGCVYTVSGLGNLTTYQNFLRSLRLVVSAESTDITKTLSLVVTDDGGTSSTALERTMFATDNLPRPTITSVTRAPTSGGTVTIVGTNFGPLSPPVVEKVTIGTQTCTSIAIVTEGTTITCVAPSGAGANLNIEVVVSGQKSPVSNLFNYESPTVTTASSVSTAGGNTTIVGTNFGAVGNANLVSQAQGNITIGGVVCTNPVVTVAHTTIVCLMPEGTGGSKDVIVTLAGQTSGTTGAGDFAYSSPTVTSATDGSFLGYYFYIYGTNFGATGTTAAVSLIQNGAASGSFSCTSVQVVNHTTIYAYVPAATTATLTTLYDVTVTVDSLSGTGSSAFQYEGPVITNITTLSYYGAVATITGRNFGNVSATSAVTAVTLGTYSITAATTTAISTSVCSPNVTTEHTTICAYFPDYVTTGNSMSPSVTVTISATPGSQTSPSYTSFAYEGPVVTNQVYGNMFGGGLTNGASVTITGRNFGKTLSGTIYDTPTITIGGTTVTGTNTVTSPTTIVITKTPADDSGPYTNQNQTVSGTLNGQTITGGTSKFSYLGPEVTSVDAFDSRGATIVINGQRFGPTGTTYYNTATYANAAITVCTNAACTSTTSCTGGSVTSVNTKLTCVLGEGAYVNNKIVVAPYTAALDSGNTGATAVTVSAPTVTAASSPPAVGGTTTITGTNFGPTGSTYVSVLIDGVACTGATVTSTPTTGDSSLTCTAAKGTGRQKNVNVTLTNNGAISSATNSLFAYAVPTVTSVTSPSTSGGTVTIVGTNFGPVGTAKVTSVTLNGGALTSATVTVDDTTIVGTYLTAGTGGGYNAAVTIDSQTSAVNTLFSYANPAVESITTAPSILGGSLVIAGQNFGPTGLAQSKITVTVSDAAATSITCSQPVVTANTQLSCVITCTTPCTTEARTVTVVIDSLTNTSASSLLTFVGPIVSSATADVSLHGSQTVTGLAPLIIQGSNFGKIDGTDGSYLTSVQVCAMPTYALCNANNGWVTATGPGTGNVPTVTEDNVKITAYIPGGITVNNTVLVTASGANSSTTGEGAFDYIAPQISFDSSNAVVNRAPTAGGTMTIAGIRFGAVGTANIQKVLWNFVDITTSAAATVLTQDTNIQLTVPSGAGSVQLSFDISFNGTAAGAMSSNVVTVKYDAPVITAVSSVGAAGGTTTITGTNFGPVGTSYLTLVKVTNSTGLYVNATSWSVTTADTQIQAVIPGGVGSALNLELELGGQTATGGAGLFSYVAPAITSVTSLPTGPPYNTTGYTGTTAAWVTITGTNLGPVGAVSSGVTIGNEACNSPNVTVAQTEIQCLLGEGSGKDYDVVFTVGAQALSGSTGSKAFAFDKPTISNITRVNYFGGDTITVTGNNFGCIPNVGSSPRCVLPRFGVTQNITLTIDGKTCSNPVVTVDHTTLTCTAPAMLDQVNITSLPVVLDVGGLNVTTYTYDYYGPKILAVTEGSLFGGTVTITGENFGPVGSSNIAFMSIGGTQQNLTTVAPTVTVNNTEIQFTSPSASGLNLTVVLVIRGQSTGTSGNGIFSYVGPRITSASSPSTAGGSLTITGRNFGPDGTTYVELLLVNGVPCTGGTVSSSGTTIVCTMPAGSGGAKDISLRINGESDENTGIGQFSYQLPTITGISPLNAGPNETITFTGESFGSNQDTISITIGGTPCTNVTLVTPHTQVSCTTPKDNGQDKQVFITVDGLTSAQGVFSYSAPQVDSTTQPIAGGGTVNITGRYFGPLGNSTLNSVYLGAAQCVNPQVIVDETVITCEAPPMKSTDDGGQFAPADLDGQGLMAVTITVNGQAGVAADKFSFIQPAVTSIGPLFGGFNDKVNVGGSNFGEVGKAVTVVVNGTASGTISGHTGIGFTFSIPPVAGVENLIQIYIYGREVNYTTLTLVDRNLVYKAPEIQQLRTIPPATTVGGNVTFVGKYFGPLGSQYIDDVLIEHPTLANTRIPCLNPTVTAADTELTCLVGAGSGKDIKVVITIAGQNSGETGLLAFRYSRPSVNRVSPSVGLPAGSLIYINGTNFGPSADSINLIKVFGPGDQQCGGIPCTEVSMAVPHIQVRCVLPISVGIGNWIVVDIGGQESLTSDAALYSYPAPTIFNVTSADTDGTSPGSLVTITGRGFGPVSSVGGGCYQTYIESVVVGKDFDGADLKCADPRVTEADSELVCLAAPGAGAGLDVTVTLRGSTTLSSGLGQFSYNPPVVHAVSALDTIGGTLTITGANFGPVTQASVPAPVVQVFSKEVCSLETNGCLSEQEQLCTNPRVVGGGHTTIECDHPAGTGGGYTVVVSIVDQPSGTSGDGAFSFAVPTTESLFPFEQPQSETSTEITIVGRNFGDNPFKINVTVGGRVVDTNTIRLFAERDRFNNPTGRSELRCLAPPGAGEGLSVIVIVDGLESPVNDAVRFSYSAPFITGSDPVPTQGGLTTIYGGNFGPRDIIPDIVTIDGQPCTDPKITVADQQITCVAPPGVGHSLDIFIQIAADQNKNTVDSGVGKFRYDCPEIAADAGVAVSPSPLPGQGTTGQLMTITGRNFGNVTGTVVVGIEYPATYRAYLESTGAVLSDYFWTTSDYQLAPGFAPSPTGTYRVIITTPVGFGTNLQVRIDVAGQDNINNCDTAAIRAPPPIYTYNPPRDLVVQTRPPTSGGRIVVQGVNFGPVGMGGVTRVIGIDYTGAGIDCLNPEVTLSNVAVECDLGPGAGGGLTLIVEVGGQATSDIEGLRYEVLSYAVPVVETISPVLVQTGDTVMVAGTNFGTTVGDIGVNVMDKDNQFYAAVPPGDIVLWEDHTTLNVTLPLGTGISHWLEVTVPFGSNKAQVSGDTVSKQYFSYEPPLVTEALPVPTQGGVAVIRGDNFGNDPRVVTNVFVAGQRCQGLIITVPEVEMRCNASRGSGDRLDVTFTVDGQESQGGLRVFQYENPVITTVQPSVAFPGTTITIFGANFGLNPVDVSVLVGDVPCASVEIVREDTEITCVVQDGRGLDVPVAVTVNNLVNPVQPNFTYTVVGCTDGAAANWDPEATVLPAPGAAGSCIYPGCTVIEALNYDPRANQNDGSCIRRPVQVQLRFRLDWVEYQSRPEFYNNLVEQNVADNVGVPKSRVNVTNAVPGSVIFTLDIFDNVTYHAVQIATDLELAVLDSTFASNLTLLEFSRITEAGPEVPIPTKANEPKVSTESIIGLIIGVVVLIVWAIYWRQLLTCVVSMCCGRKRKVGVEVAQYEDPDEEAPLTPAGKGQVTRA